ncbi:MAG: hypothetical protein CVV24_03040 [Ignavibacteriae bacterium HGW-Ignavibacteriae-3]|nr:MAG: hypothetical protein CVV24_03040 [Ignavibacteriae bacterium HGW-Ignavibacteriae-3]
MKLYLTFIICLITIFSTVIAQEDTLKASLLVFSLIDQTEYVGKIESSESNFLNIITRENQKVRIAKEKIKEVVKYEDSDLSRREKEAIEMKGAVKDSITHKEYTDANLNRMIIFPTARPMKPGQGYIQLNELFFPYAAIGIGKFLTLGGGISIVPTFQKQVIYFSPKVTPLHSENLDLAAGVFYMTMTDFSNIGFKDGVGIAYSMTTLGDPNKNISIGFGWGFSGDNFSKKPVLILGGDIKIGRNLKLLAETWTPLGTNFMLGMVGFRVIGKYVSGDAVIIRPFSSHSGGSSIVPWFSLTYNFGYDDEF